MLPLLSASWGENLPGESPHDDKVRANRRARLAAVPQASQEDVRVDIRPSVPDSPVSRVGLPGAGQGARHDLRPQSRRGHPAHAAQPRSAHRHEERGGAGLRRRPRGAPEHRRGVLRPRTRAAPGPAAATADAEGEKGA